MDKIKTVLWWGRFNPGYSRNRILRDLLHDNGWEVVDFHPSWSSVGDLQALLKRMPRPDLIWVPNFRQRDFYAAKRYARRLNVPILFDPLISSYDKRVFENRKLAAGSFRAERLRKWEGGMFKASNIILADTHAHARFFTEVLGADPARIFIVPVGAEEKLFVPQPGRAPAGPVEVLFYGSFVPLQGVRFIVEAARLVPEVNWAFVGQGKLRETCERASVDLANVSFEDWVPYSQLAERIGKADILLGIFGDTPKASRVIPNKLYQAIACARPIITMDSPVYSQDVREAGRSGVAWIPAASPEVLANAVRQWAKHPEMLEERGQSARALYDRFYANDKVADALMKALSVID